MYVLITVVWWPLQAPFMAALAAGAEVVLRLLERPPIITALTPRGNVLRLTTTLDDGLRPAAAWDGRGLHLYVAASLAMALAVPLKNRRRRLRLVALAFGLAWAAAQAITVVQVESVAGAHAAALLGVAIHTAAGEALLAWANRGLIMIGMLLLPTFVFLVGYVTWLEEATALSPGPPASSGPRGVVARRTGRMRGGFPRSGKGRSER